MIHFTPETISMLFLSYMVMVGISIGLPLQMILKKSALRNMIRDIVINILQYDRFNVQEINSDQSNHHPGNGNVI